METSRFRIEMTSSNSMKNQSSGGDTRFPHVALSSSDVVSRRRRFASTFRRFISRLRRFAWSWKVTVKTGFKKLSDSQALAIAGAVINGLFVDKAIAAAPPFDETTLQTAVDDLTGAIAAQAQAGGCTAVTAVKNKKRSVLDGLLRRLAQYVQANCNDDVQFVLKSGFQAKTTAVRSQTPLDKATILSVDNGHTKQLVVAAQKVPRAKLYEVQAAAVGANNTVGPFQTAGRLQQVSFDDHHRPHAGHHLRHPGTCAGWLDRLGRLE